MYHRFDTSRAGGLTLIRVPKILSRVALIMFGTALALGLLEAGMRVAGHAIRSAQNRDNARRLRHQHQFRVLCLGESTTAGESGIPRYPELLQEILNRQDLGVSVVAINMGRSGAVTRDLVEQLETESEAFKPNVIVAMMGINDGGKTHAYGSIIEPGRGRWYGTFRLYKLYRLVKHKLWIRGLGRSSDDLMALGEGIYQPTPGIDRAFVRPGPTPPQPTPRPPGDFRFLERVHRLIRNGDSLGARHLLEERLSRDPEFADGYVELARLYDHLEDPNTAHKTLLRGAHALSSPSFLLQTELATSYDKLGQTDRAIEIVEAIRRDLLQPTNLVDHTHQTGVLADLYEKSGRLDAAEAALKEIAEKINPGYSRFFDELIAFYERHDRPEDAAFYRSIRRKVRHEYVNPETRKNYRKLMEVVRSRGIQLYAVQYPGRNVEETKRLLGLSSWPHYVDNSFYQKLVEENGYDAYYTDTFAGDFGHLTALGNALLAENIARAIVEHSFERELVDVPLADLIGGGLAE